MARSSRPTGREIAEQARQLRFDDAKAVEATRDRDHVRVRFIPTRFEQVMPREELEAGLVVGRVEAQLGRYQGQYKASLRSGTYHLFIAKVDGTWQGYAELDGAVAIEAKQVTIDEGTTTSENAKELPTIEFGSICFSFCMIVIVPVPIPIPPYEIPVPIPVCWSWCI